MDPIIIQEASATQDPVFIILLAVAGFGFGVVVSLAKGYFSTVEEEEKSRLRDVRQEAESTLESVLQSVRISALFRRKRSSKN